MNINELFPVNDETKWHKMADIVHSRALANHTALVNYQSLSFSRWLMINILIFLLQYVGLMFTTLTQQNMPIYFSTGIACAFMFLRGCQIAPGIWLGSFVAYYFMHSGVFVAIACATLFTLQPLVLLWFSYRYIQPTLIVRDAHFLFQFFLLSVLVTALISFLQLQICYPLLQTSETFILLWVKAWLANLNGILIIAYAILSLDMYFPQMNELQAKAVKMIIAWYSLLIVLSVFMLFYFDVWPILLAMMMALGMKYRWPGLVLANFVFGLVVTLFAYLGVYQVTLSMALLLTLCPLMLGVV